MNDIRRYITILENASQDELQKYRDEQEYWQNEHKKYWPVSPELMAQYKDGTHTGKDRARDLYWQNKNGQHHRDNDKPAVIGRNGRLEWWQNNQQHRDDDKPAVIDADGTLWWFQNSLKHRDGDKPAIIWADGSLQWFQNGKPHRDDDKPAIISANGSLQWFQNGQRHRFGGPAVIYPNSKQEWYWRGDPIPVKSQEEFIEYLKKHKGLQRFRVNKP